jgi:glycosyltransferase involved in cell wall biosynthesis
LKKLRDFSRGRQNVAEGLQVFSPIAIPFHASRAARWVNHRTLKWSLRRVCRRLGFRNPITWTFMPTSADVAGALGEQMLIYHCVDEFSEFTGINKAAIESMEHSLMERSDCVIVSSDLLYANKKRHNRNTFLVKHGVDTAHFRLACKPETIVPEEIRRLKGPVIGFFGLIADWVDLELIRFLAASRPQWNLVLIGKTVTDVRILDGVSNIHLLGQKPYELLPAYAKGFHVAILPFLMNDLTLAANPLKLREYLAAGLPVVSSPLPEAEGLKPLVQLARSQSEFLKRIEGVIDSRDAGPHIEVSRRMDSESWDEKVEQLSRIVAGLQQTKAA